LLLCSCHANRGGHSRSGTVEEEERRRGERKTHICSSSRGGGAVRGGAVRGNVSFQTRSTERRLSLMFQLLLFSFYFVLFPSFSLFFWADTDYTLVSCSIYSSSLLSPYPGLCHPLIDAPSPIYTSALALTPINYLASLSQG